MKFYFTVETVKYAKITYQNESGKLITTRAGVKSIDEKRIVICTKYEDNLQIEIPQEISLSIVCNEGLYKTKAKLTKIINDAPYVFFYLDTPKGIDYEQNREYFRVIAEYNCVYSVFQNGEKKEYETKTYDISANGISLILPTHAISESSSLLTISIANKTIKTKIKYIRSEKVQGGYKIAFTYTAITEADRDFISQVCIQKQLEDRRNSLR